MKNKPLGILLVCVVGLPTTALAQTPPYAVCESNPACVLLYEQAQQQSKAGQLLAALNSYKLAHGVNQDPRLLFSVARVLDKTGQAAEAITYYRRFIDSAVDDANQKDKAREYLTLLQAKQPASTSTEALQDQKKIDPSLALDVTVVGPGRVVSQPKGLDCIQGNGCSAKFQAVAEQKLVTLRAEPTGAAASVIWSGSPCQNSILTDPRRCDLPISGSQKVTVGFERSSQRKIATGVFGGLAGAGLVISAVLLGLNGQDAGRCGDGGITHSSGCVYNLITPGLVTTGLTVGLGVGTALIWWLPTARESK